MRLNKLLVILSAILIFAGISQAVTTFGIQAGYAGSAYEDQEEAATGIALGAHFGIDLIPMIEAGVEANYTISPFKFEEAGIEAESTQLLIGAYGKLYPLPLIIASPYVKAGIGYYSGEMTVSAAGQSESFDYKGAIGFQIGAGVELPLGLYGEFVFNIVEREVDVENTEAFGANNWMLSVGYKF